jgi:hypothetical protein
MSGSASVAFKVGGYAGQSEVAVIYVHTKSGWVKAGEWNIGYPNNLSDLKEMGRLAAELGHRRGAASGTEDLLPGRAAPQSSLLLSTRVLAVA